MRARVEPDRPGSQVKQEGAGSSRDARIGRADACGAHLTLIELSVLAAKLSKSTQAQEPSAE